MSEPKRIAAILTTFYPDSHGDCFVPKFLYGFPCDEGLIAPRVKLASVYMDQMHPRDMGVELLNKFNVPVYPSIRAALTRGGEDLQVDGVLLIAEHGDYPSNRRQQQLYPRKHLFEQICGTFEECKRSVPVFNDKHLSYNWADAKWMADRAVELDVPFMAGSSIPYSWRNPWIEFDKGVRFEEALGIGYGPVESYGFHTLEGLQCMVERRHGGESGVRSVQSFQGPDVWKAADQGLWSMELAEAICAQMEGQRDRSIQESVKSPVLFKIEYNDGLSAVAVMLTGYSPGFGFGAKIAGKIQANHFRLWNHSPWTHFSYLCLNIEEMFVTGKAVVPVERTLLVSGILEAAMTSLSEGGTRIDTPQLAITYDSYDRLPFHPRKSNPEGQSIAPWPPA